MNRQATQSFTPVVPVASHPNVPCEQAIFTSARTMAGQGYQITAVSGGLNAGDYAEIVRRCPSNGNLERTDQTAEGLMTWVGSRGQRCIAYCHHAGREPSGRPGWRVLTHLAVMEPAAFVQMNADPVSVHALLARAARPTRMALCPPERLPPLQVPLPVGKNTPPFPNRDMRILLRYILRELQADRQLMLTHVSHSLDLLSWVYRLVPHAVRCALNASVAVKFSPSRDMQLILLEGEPDPALLRASGQHPPLQDARALIAAQIR